MSTLILERKDQEDDTAEIDPILLTPCIDENYWTYRVRLGETQAIVGFPKFSTIGIGFAIEDDWNTNLPYTCGAEKIYNPIKHNRAVGGDSISDEDCLAAIRMVQEAAAADRSAK